jgi:aminoglycoside phosphotransferase (APT) family kinase protein
MGGRAKPLPLELLSARLAVAFPDLGGPVECRMLASGFRSTVVETSAGIVLRIGKNEAAARGFAREARLLPALAGRLPLTVPNPHWYCPPSRLFPFGVLGYEKLPGVTLSPERLAHSHYHEIARDIAHFLVALHSFPAHEATALGMPVERGVASWLASVRDRIMPTLRKRLSEAEHRRLEEWWLGVSTDSSLNSYEPALCHGDLWYENILVDEQSGRVIGVLDFENAAVGDRARDFATQLHLGPDFAQQVVAEYRKAGGTLEEGIEHRMDVWWTLRELDGLDFALRTNDRVELDDAMLKLRRGPVLGSSLS